MSELISIIGKKSPEFAADAVQENEIIRVNSFDLFGQYVLLFFYESDFSFVCPTEMYALQDTLQEFKKRNVLVAGVSVNPIQSHLAWLKTARSRGGIEGITFMLISDVSKILSKAYKIYDEKEGSCLRGTFIIDRTGTVQYGSVNSFEIGRNIPDILRTIDAIQYTETSKELCPMDWQAGQKPINLNSLI